MTHFCVYQKIKFPQAAENSRFLRKWCLRITAPIITDQSELFVLAHSHRTEPPHKLPEQPVPSSCVSLGNKGKSAATTNSFGFGARYSLGNIKHRQQAVFLCRQLCLIPRRRSHALSNGPLCFTPSICYSTAHPPRPCQRYASSDASHCTFNHCL